MTGWWSRIPVPEQHVVGLVTGLVLDLVIRRRLPRAAVAAGAPLIVGGLVVAGAAVAARGGEDLDRPDRLVTHGPYAWSRHPMYVAWSALHLGLALAIRSPGSLLTWPVSAALLHRTILDEERALSGRFGDAYAAYEQSVPRYFPFTIAERNVPQ